MNSRSFSLTSVNGNQKRNALARGKATKLALIFIKRFSNSASMSRTSSVAEKNVGPVHHVVLILVERLSVVVAAGPLHAV